MVGSGGDVELSTEEAEVYDHDNLGDTSNMESKKRGRSLGGTGNARIATQVLISDTAR